MDYNRYARIVQARIRFPRRFGAGTAPTGRESEARPVSPVPSPRTRYFGVLRRPLCVRAGNPDAFRHGSPIPRTMRVRACLLPVCVQQLQCSRSARARLDGPLEPGGRDRDPRMPPVSEPVRDPRSGACAWRSQGDARPACWFRVGGWRGGRGLVAGRSALFRRCVRVGTPGRRLPPGRGCLHGMRTRASLSAAPERICDNFIVFACVCVCVWVLALFAWSAWM